MDTTKVLEAFTCDTYVKHDAARLAHFGSLGLDLASKTTLEVGAGIGNHTVVLKKMGCNVTVTDARLENLEVIKSRFNDVPIKQLDLDNPPEVEEVFDVVYCYGTLYHLCKPEAALEFMSKSCLGMLLMETCVSFVENNSPNFCSENKDRASRAYSGTGCRPSRSWIYSRLKKLFAHVYMPITQPNHAEFPIDWTNKKFMNGNLNRSIFVASREKIDNPLLVEELLMKQKRFEG